MRLNVCCGIRIRPGWVNIDLEQKMDGPQPDIIADARKVPLPDDCADELMCIHGFEHFYPFEVEDLIAEWRRLLRVGGKLILELPDLVKCCENLLSGYTLPGKHPDQMSMWGLYGDPRTRDPYMMHRWGWTPKTLKAFLKDHGFANINSEEPQWHPAGRVRRDMRMVAVKV